MNLPQASRSIEHFLHAYAMAPWRAQRQWIGAILLGVIGVGMVAALYLDITSQAAIAGRQIQNMRDDIVAMELVNADLQSQLAQATSSSSMEKRARDLGYEPVKPADLQYLPVPGFVEPQPVILATAGGLRPSAASVAPEYTESLFAWLGRTLEASAENRTEAR
ncbi:MAG TPA: hypothetical protein VIU38_14755 [Anaerolineales bacterium]